MFSNTFAVDKMQKAPCTCTVCARVVRTVIFELYSIFHLCLYFFVYIYIHGNRDMPTPETIFHKIREVCVTKMDLCAYDENIYEGQEGEDQLSSKCQRCLTITQSMQDVLLRKKGREAYRSRKHVWGVLDDLCSDLPMRFPIRAAQRLVSYCEDLVADYEEEIADAFMNSESPIKEICFDECTRKNKRAPSSWEGWKSPWAAVPREHVHFDL